MIVESCDKLSYWAIALPITEQIVGPNKAGSKLMLRVLSELLMCKFEVQRRTWV